MPRAIRFDKYGGVDVLQVVEVEKPSPAAGQAVVRVKAAGINPGEASVRKGLLEKMYPTTFPCGQGSDFAGLVESVGSGVTAVAPGDEVIGYSNSRSSHADFVKVSAEQLVARPPNVPWEQAGALFVAGTTAYAAVRVVALKPADTLVVSGAAGGVGSLAVQLAKKQGAKVIGLASAPNHPWLLAHGVIPLEYEANHGGGLSDRIRATAGGPIDAFIDTSGKGYVELALKLGIAPQRIDTIIDFEAAKRHSVKAEGSAAAATPEVLAELVAMMGSGALEIPIYKVYPLDQVREAYRELERGHSQGKIVLVP